jgi:dinuclear metal center YbgI/SA1388 family protein
MFTIATIADFLERFAPPRLAEDWDNVGLLVGRRERPARRVMTCLTITPTSAAEAVRDAADLIVTHHPMPFHAMRRLTGETPTGAMLLDLIAAGVAVYSPHTAFDSAREGINQRLAQGLGLRGVAPLVPAEDGLGSGRFGWLGEAITLGAFVGRVKAFLRVEHVQYVGEPDRAVQTVAVACGAAGEFLEPARRMDCDAMLLGETRFHTCLEAEAAGIALVLPGHYASERFAIEALSDVLAAQFPSLSVWPSGCERDPLRWA